MRVRILGMFESPIPGDPENESVVFEGSVGTGRIRVETNRYHRLEIVIAAEGEVDGVLLEADPILCSDCQAEVDEVDVVCSDCEGIRRGD